MRQVANTVRGMRIDGTLGVLSVFVMLEALEDRGVETATYGEVVARLVRNS